MNEYEKQAKAFLEKYGFKLSVTYITHEINESWNDNQYRPKYRIRITRKQTRRSLTFNFWDSIAHDHEGKRPTAYDVLACLSSDQYCPDNFEEFCGEYGYDTDSIKASKLFKVCSRFAKRIKAFFTITELGELSEIR